MQPLFLFIIVSLTFLLSGCKPKKKEDKANPFCVAVSQQSANLIQKECVAYAKITSNRIVNLQAEVSGKVIQVSAPRGAFLEKNAPILELDSKEKLSTLNKAQAVVRQKELEYKAAKELVEKGYESNRGLEAAKAALEEALAQAKKASQELEYTIIKAPFAGYLNTRLVEEGDYVQAGTSLGNFIENDPLLAVIHLSQQDRMNIALNNPALVHINEEVIPGHIHYISQDSNPHTRTYEAHIQFANPNYSFPAGLSAVVVIHEAPLQAHKISPSTLCLDEKGNLGVKTVNEASQVVFYEANIVKSTQEYMWITGLPEDALIIIQGQGFVKPGQTVTITKNNIQE